MSGKRIYRLWSGEHHAWWREGCCGYTDVEAEAGLYTRAEVREVLAVAGPEKRLKAIRLPVAWLVVMDWPGLDNPHVVVTAVSASAAKYKVFLSWWDAGWASVAQTKHQAWLFFSAMYVRRVERRA